MKHWPRPAQSSLRAKVLIPVVSILVLLAVVPMWLVTHRMSRQLESSAAENLRADDAVFRNLLGIRAKNLLLRYRNIPNEPRFKAVFQLSDPNTLRVLLHDLVEEAGAGVVQFVDPEARPLASAAADPRFNADQFSNLCAPSARRALQGQPNVAVISIRDRLYDVASIPASVGETIVGALTFASEIDESVAREFTQLTRGEVVLLAAGRIAISTVDSPGLADELTDAVAAFARGAPEPPGTRGSAQPRNVVIDGQHYVYSTGRLDETSEWLGLGYILLSSYERPLRVLQATERTFFWIQLAGILLSTGFVWIHVQRVTRPLRQLRDNAEAVGRGDFSHRVDVSSRDECGELAAVFNQMTSNLQTSREALEATVERLGTTQAQLIQSEKMRAIGTLAGGIAHDFNNILGAIIGYTELVLLDAAAGSRTARNLEQVLKAGQRAKDLVRQILAFSRQSEVKRRHVRLGAIMDEALKLLRASIPATVTIQVERKTDADTVVADPTQLHQILMNLGTNASHAMSEKGGTLKVTLDECPMTDSGASARSALPPGPYLRLSVADTGCGMEPAVLERIFEPFFTTKPVGVGTGLGLSVVHGIVKDHGGDVTVTSQRGAGTTFHILLPRAATDGDSQTTHLELARGNHERILVVDDEEPLANMMHQRLARLGYEVVAHHDSAEALREFQAAPNRFDLVITDLTMPHVTGYDLAREVARHPSKIPVIICTGSGNVSGNAPPEDSCVQGMLSKPVDFALLSQTIRQVLGQRVETPAGRAPAKAETVPAPPRPTSGG